MNFLRLCIYSVDTAIYGSNMLRSYIAEDSPRVMGRPFQGDHVNLQGYELDAKRENTLWHIPAYHVTYKFWYRDLAMHRGYCGRRKAFRVSWACFRCTAYTGLMRALASLAKNSEIFRICINYLDVWVTVARFFFMPSTYKDHEQIILLNDSFRF